jgi:hypothetical protein
LNADSIWDTTEDVVTDDSKVGTIDRWVPILEFWWPADVGPDGSGNLPTTRLGPIGRIATECAAP